MIFAVQRLNVQRRNDLLEKNNCYFKIAIHYKMSGREDLKMKLKLKIASAKMGRLPQEARDEKVDKLKDGLNEILKSTGMTADDFLSKVSQGGQSARK